MKNNFKFKIGDSVVAKPDVTDEELNIGIGGWQGRVSEIFPDDNMICIDWDSVTLKNMPDSAITECEEKGMGWNQFYLETDSVELAEPRDTQEDVANMFGFLQDRHCWDFLGEEGRRIRKVLKNVDPNDHWKAFKVWKKHLEQVLKFPFKAEVSEFQERGPLRDDAKVIVEKITDIADPYGIIVLVRHGRKRHHFPLCDLDATDSKSSNYRNVNDYSIWFSNR